MNKAVWLAISCLAGACGLGCSSTTGGSGGHATTTTSGTTSTSSSTTTTNACSGATPVALTVKNYLDWCNVAVAGGTASSAASQTVCVAAGAVKVDATALTGFELGTKPWHDVDGDTGGTGVQGTVTGTGQSAQSEATVTVTSGSKCVWVCCETVGMMDCPTMDQCP